jgi:predicted membrane-bound mannosyltransferase/DNA-binding beta-propeller fold protein YncE
VTARAARRPAALSPLDRLLAVRISINLEVALYVAVFALAFGLRFWDLGARALHHDESIHAQWSWRLLQGDYTHDPIFHGPLYYHAQALVFFIFGASDYTSRVSAAIFGSALVALPLLLRRRLGAVGTFAAISLIAFSPTLVYYSRFFREDIYMGFFTMGMVVAMWRYFADGRDRWLILFAVMLAGSMTTKEATYITVAVFLVFLDLYVSAELASRTLAARGMDSAVRRWVLTLSLAPWAWTVAALWPFLGPVRRRMDWDDDLPLAGDVLVLLGTLILPLLTPFLKGPLEDRGWVDKGRLACRANIPRDDAIAMGGLFAVVGSMAAFAGLQWRPRTWAIAAACAAAIYLTLMTSFWTNLGGVCTGPWGSLDYWLSQHDQVRGDQPWFYYHMLMPAYEFLPLALCIGGLWWSVARGTAFSRFLVLWLAGTWLALSWAGEKMPWLNTHLALPACILAAWTVQRAWRSWTPRPPVRKIAGPLAAVAVMAAGAMIAIAWMPGGTAYLIARVVIALAVASAIVYAMRPSGRQATATTLVVTVVGALAFLSLRTMVMAAYVRGDDPRDLLIYTQSSGQIPKIATDIDRLAEATGKGFSLPIAVDSTDSFAWPWAWYLRDYKSVSYVDFTNGAPQGDYAVLLVNASNVNRVQDALAQAGVPRFGAPQKYPHRWWFEEQYKQALITTSGASCTARAGDCGPFTGTLGPLPNFVPNTKTWKTIGEGIRHGWITTWLLYIRDHDPGRPNGSVDAYAFFPATFDRATGTLSARPIEPSKPTRDSAGRLTFGGLGPFPGQFFANTDIEIDAAGNLYVIDSASKKLQKFDSQGNFLVAVDIRVNPQDASEQSQPWGLAVAPDGTIVVADTFGWRVRVFDAALKPAATFGKAPDVSKDPGTFDLFGPRDAIFDSAGNIWITDTGNDRIMVYTRGGEFVRQVGSRGSGPGQLDEPVGLSMAADGTVFVADMYNHRVEMFRQDGSFAGDFQVAGWGGQEVVDKPYLRALRDGRIAVSLPLQNQVRIYDRSGKLTGTIAPTDVPLDRPYGMVETADAKLWISEGGAGRVRLFDIP